MINLVRHQLVDPLGLGPATEARGRITVVRPSTAIASAASYHYCHSYLQTTSSTAGHEPQPVRPEV
jgi:hypothetical protein